MLKSSSGHWSYFIFSSPWSQINCVIDWRESSNGALAQQSLGRPSPSGADVRFPHSQSGRGPRVSVHPTQQLPETSREESPVPRAECSFRFSISRWLDHLSSAPVWWTGRSPSPGESSCCLPRQAMLQCPTFPLMSFVRESNEINVQLAVCADPAAQPLRINPAAESRLTHTVSLVPLQANLSPGWAGALAWPWADTSYPVRLLTPHA